ncbi:MAG: M3 family oligoendopeptidase [Candidatus Omnitrophota bacterium]|nr:M3 family oligoendopeptidase [Candidatus Omnitrophota bacterium]MDZ4241326.1 M3 family oligoendopeptidase [Candidatus Omnitrophota bacterium]
MPTTAAESLDFDRLPKYRSRRFVPAEARLTDKEEVVRLYEALLGRDIRSASELEIWLQDRFEMDAAVSQAGEVLYIRMTCQTDDAKRSGDYKDFVENILPSVKQLEHRLNEKYWALKKDWPLDAAKYRVYDRSVETDLALFREENIPLLTKVQLLSQDYQTVCGAMTVPWDGKDLTMPQVGRFLMDPDRPTRERAWKGMAHRRLDDRDKLDKLFDEMLALRHTVALNAGFKNFIEYQFKSYHRFDYSSRECRQYHEAVAALVVPLCAKIMERRRRLMRLPHLRPWDVHVDPLGRPALKPFIEVRDLITGLKKIFNRLDPQLGGQFDAMAKMGLLDLDSRKGKAPGGYQNTMAEARLPFIFMNAVGVDQDVRTLLHEGGHAFHAFACAPQDIRDYRHAPMEFCEVASMSMELIGGEYLDVFYGPEEWERSKIDHLEDVIQVLAWVANIDAFQHWIYEVPQHAVQERSQAWLGFYNRFGGQLMEWKGLEMYQESLWHRQLHIFEVPFYYIEYGIAQLGALQLWLNAKKDLGGTVAKYKEALALGGSRPLPELFEAAGLKFDFSARTIAPLIAAVQEELGLTE